MKKNRPTTSRCCFLTLIVMIMSLYSLDNSDSVYGNHQTDCRVWEYTKGGVPFYRYPDSGLQFNPLFAAEEVIFHAKEYERTGNRLSFDAALHNSDWLMNNAKAPIVARNLPFPWSAFESAPITNFSLLYYDFSFPSFEMDPPWRSGLAQAVAVEALARMHEITNNQTYLDTAKSLLNSFFVEIKDGGVTIKTPQDGWWYEEYADEDTPPPRVLNGMLWSLLSVHKYYEHTNDEDAKLLFDQGIRAVEKNLQFYDNGGDSYYDINKKPAVPFYHYLHIDLLEQLLNIVNDDILRVYQEKWKDFTIASDITPPEVISINASDGKEVSISATFSEPVSESLAIKSVYVVQAPKNMLCTLRGDAIPGTVNLSSDERTVIFKPSIDLIPKTNYTLIITTAVEDLAGNNMMSAKAWKFAVDKNN